MMRLQQQRRLAERLRDVEKPVCPLATLAVVHGNPPASQCAAK
jgi:hypothetical protein